MNWHTLKLWFQVERNVVVVVSFCFFTFSFRGPGQRWGRGNWGDRFWVSVERKVWKTPEAEGAVGMIGYAGAKNNTDGHPGDNMLQRWARVIMQPPPHPYMHTYHPVVPWGCRVMLWWKTGMGGGGLVNWILCINEALSRWGWELRQRPKSNSQAGRVQSHCNLGVNMNSFVLKG